jgi:hypothetical protein
MQLELRPEIVDRLVTMPETGMGYQVVDLVLVDGRVLRNVTVFNSEVANVPEEFHDLRPSDVMDVRPSQSGRFGRS